MDDEALVKKKKLKPHYSAENVLKRIVRKAPSREKFAVGNLVLFLGLCCPVLEVWPEHVIILHGNSRIKINKTEAVIALGVNETPPEKVDKHSDEDY